MGKLKNETDKLVGKVKETVGDVTGNDKVEIKGESPENIR